MTAQPLDAHNLPLTMPLWPDAAQILGMGRNTAYELAKRGEFPIRVLQLGGKKRVSRADLLAYLGESVSLIAPTSSSIRSATRPGGLDPRPARMRRSGRSEPANIGHNGEAL